MNNVLVLDDDAAVRTVMVQALRRAGYRVSTATTLAQLDRQLVTDKPDVLITDVVLPDGDGLEHMGGVMLSYPDLPIIVVSARNTLTTAIRASEIGAYEYLPKPFDLDALTHAVSSALSRNGMAACSIEIEEITLPLIGRSAAMQDVYRTISKTVSNDLTVLISGESGTGKELVARAIHDLGPRKSAKFVAINMAAIPRDLVEAELFGHERGAFTGAVHRSTGRFEQADGGTLFLDEIGDMPLDAQTRLLRVLQTGEFTTIGGSRTIRVDVRIIAATNRKLMEQVNAGLFREDLFYRLHVVPLALPPLREREQDIALLARHFLDQAAMQGLPRRQLSADAVALLMRHDWPGNVRELENLMRRLAVLARDDIISADTVTSMTGGGVSEPDTVGLPDMARAVHALLAQIARERAGALDDGTLYARIIGEVEKPLIEAMLVRHRGNQGCAARALGINRNTLKKRMDLLSITTAEY